MRKSGKLLLGVLSVAALIGTGMGAFVINGTYGSDTDTIGVTTTEEYYSRGFNITAEKADNDGINFDGTGGDYLVTYTVKATAIDGGFTQDALYNPDTWKAVAEEYRPNLKISATHTNVDETREDFFNKYVVLPDVATISYETWLAANLKETGYTYEFKVEWKKEALGGYSTPNEYFATVDNATGKEVYNEIKSGLEYAKITVTFEAGYYEGGSTVDPTPSVDTTGTVTLPDTATSNALLAISGTQENGTIEAGEQTLSLTLEEGYELEALNVSVDGAAADPVIMKEVPSDVLSLANPGKKYEGTYTFEKGKTYEFSVVTKASTPPIVKYAKVSVAQNENASVVIANASEDGNYKVNSAVSFTAEALNGYRITSVYYTVEGSEDKNVLTGTEGTYSFTVSSEAAHTIVVETDVYEMSYLIENVTEDSDNAKVAYATRGTIVVVNTGGVVITDGTNLIYLMDNTIVSTFTGKEGKVVEVTGVPCLYNNICVEYTWKLEFTVTLVENAVSVEAPKLDESITAADLRSDNLDNIKYKRIKVRGTCGISDNHTNFYNDDMGFSSISMVNSSTKFEDGATYDLEGYVAWVSGDKYLYLYEVSATKVEVPVAYATVTAAQIENGTVTITDAVEGNKYEVGSTITWTVSPEQGYEVVSYWYTVDGGEPITVGSGSLEITQADATYTVGATMKTVEEGGSDVEALTSLTFTNEDFSTWGIGYGAKGPTDVTKNNVTTTLKTNAGSKQISDGNGFTTPLYLGLNSNAENESRAKDTSVLNSKDYLTSEMLGDYTTADDLWADNAVFVLSFSFTNSLKMKDITINTQITSTSKNWNEDKTNNKNLYLVYKSVNDASYNCLTSSADSDFTKVVMTDKKISHTFAENTDVSEIALVVVGSGFSGARRVPIGNIVINS